MITMGVRRRSGGSQPPPVFLHTAASVASWLAGHRVAARPIRRGPGARGPAAMSREGHELTLLHCIALRRVLRRSRGYRCGVAECVRGVAVSSPRCLILGAAGPALFSEWWWFVGFGCSGLGWAGSGDRLGLADVLQAGGRDP